jgi:hypothetical protein
MSALGKFLWSGLRSGGNVHDYAHAANVFRPNNYGSSPKTKYLFQVNFVLNPAAPDTTDIRQVSYLVKTIELPKFSMDVRDLNQYNRKTYIQTKIKYEPISIRFHDDIIDDVRHLWQDYYNYYFSDGNYDINTYLYDDRYMARLFSSWGLDNGATGSFFNSIEIYSLANGSSSKITLMNPVITAFSHDTHDYADGQGLMEAVMTIHYNGVVYEDGYASGTPNFASPNAYDTNLSGISGQYAGYAIDPATGQLVQGTDSFFNNTRYSMVNTGQLDPQIQARDYNPSAANSFSIPEIQSIIQNSKNNNTGGDYSFPVATYDPPVQTTYNPPESATNIPLNATSDGADVKTPADAGTVFTDGSYQQALYYKGYTPEEIKAASDFVDTGTSVTNQVALSSSFNASNPSVNKLTLAERFLADPEKYTNPNGVNYGQAAVIPAQIDFSNPASPVNPIYNSNTWQNQLLLEGYTANDIAQASSQLAKINVSPGTDLTNIARNYILYNKNQSKVL